MNYDFTIKYVRYLYLGKILVYILELSQKIDFQTSTIKSDNKGHRTVGTEQIWPFSWLVIFHFMRIKNIQFQT